MAESIRAAEDSGSRRHFRAGDRYAYDQAAGSRSHRARGAETGAIVVAEEHLVDGGLGVRVAQVVAETHPVPMEFVGIQNTYAESATPEQLLDKYGLLARDVAAAARRVASASAE